MTTNDRTRTRALIIRIPDSLHRDYKVMLAKRGMTARKHLQRCIERYSYETDKDTMD